MKKIFSILPCLPLLLFSACARNDESSKPEIRTEAQMAAIAFNNKFLDFSIYIYPDCYAGKYYSDDGEKFIINVTSTETGDFDFLLSEFDCVELNLVKYSWQELNNLADLIDEDLENDFPEIEFAQATVDLKRNCLIIELFQETLDDSDTMNALQLYFSDQPVVFELPPLSPLI